MREIVFLLLNCQINNCKMKLYFTSFFFVFVSLITSGGFAQKIDTVFHTNGNILTGDFKKMAYGVVNWSMSGMGTISLEQVVVNSIKSPKLFEVKLKNGLIYFGSFDTAKLDRKVNVVLTNGKQLVAIEDIVEIYPLKRSFWLRLSGNFNMGLNYSKGSDVATVTFSGNLSYRKRKSYWNISWDDNNTFQADTLSSTKADANISLQRTLKKMWSLGAGVGMSQNSELGIKYNFDLTFLGIRDIVYNNWNRFFVGAGLSLQRGISYGDSPSTTDLAGSFTIAWKVYKYTPPKVWVDANITYIPYITTNRTRVNINVNPSIKVFSDNFKVGLTTYYSYDSQQQSETTSTDDWGVNLTLGYSFH